MKKIVKLIIGLLSAICPLMLFIILKNNLPFQFHLIIVISYVLIFIILSFILLQKYAKTTSLFITFSMLEAKSVLIDRESLSKSSEFKRLLGYINTPTDQQKKGASGREK